MTLSQDKRGKRHRDIAQWDSTLGMYKTLGSIFILKKGGGVKSIPTVAPWGLRTSAVLGPACDTPTTGPLPRPGHPGASISSSKAQFGMERGDKERNDKVLCRSLESGPRRGFHGPQQLGSYPVSPDGSTAPSG